MNNHKQGNDQEHKYVHGGLLRRNEIDEINKNKQVTYIQMQQIMHEGKNEDEDDLDTQEYAL
eukprot:10233160-Heterocapsa_arctica.AAC.1